MAHEPEGSSGSGLGLDGFHTKPSASGLSLDQLKGAFAEMLGRGDDPYSDAAEEGEHQTAEAAEQDAAPLSPESILEALLFVGNSDNQPLRSAQVAEMMRGVRPAEIDELVRSLNARYEADQCPYRIVSEGAGYRLALRDQFAALRDAIYGGTRQATLSAAAIEVLAIVAYGQPITSDQVSQQRGVGSGGVLAQLVRRQLLRLERPAEKPRTPVYCTTDRFLRLFGLASLDELPQSQDLENQ